MTGRSTDSVRNSVSTKPRSVRQVQLSHSRRPHVRDVVGIGTINRRRRRILLSQIRLAFHSRGVANRRSHAERSCTSVGTCGRFQSATEQMALLFHPVTAMNPASLRPDVAEQQIHADKCGALCRHGGNDAVEGDFSDKEISRLRIFSYTTIRNNNWMYRADPLDAAHNKSICCASTSS